MEGERKGGEGVTKQYENKTAVSRSEYKGV